MPENFDQVLAGCRTGDARCFKTFAIEFYGGLIRTARRRLRDEERAKDAVQSFFLMIIEKELLCQFRGNRIGQLRRFLNRCMVNHINSEMREFIVSSRESELDERLFASSAASAEEEFERNSIREIIQKIDWKYRQILELELESYKQREIAEMLSMPPGTVAAYSHRAKEALARLLRTHGFALVPIVLALFLNLKAAA